MKKNKISKILKIAIVVMVMTNGVLVYNYVKKPTPAVASVSVSKANTIDIKSIENELKSVNKIKVLENELIAKYNFDNDSKKIKNEKGNKVGFIKKALSELTYNSISVTQKYGYDVSYDFNNLKFENNGSNVIINVYESQLEFSDLASAEKPVITRDNGVLASDFSSQEVLNMSYFLSKEAKNHVINNPEIKDKAINSLKRNIGQMISKLTGNIKYEIKVIPSNILNYEDEDLEAK